VVSSSGGVKDSWASARPRTKAIEVSSRRFEIHVYDPERTELEVSGVEDEALPDLGANSMQSRAIPGRLECFEIDQQTTKRQCVRLQGLLTVLGGKDLGANITKLFDGATDREKARPHR
jgi:hypothetical protein